MFSTIAVAYISRILFTGRLYREHSPLAALFHQFRSFHVGKTTRQGWPDTSAMIFIRIHFCPKNSGEIRRVFGCERLDPKIRGRNKQIRTSVPGYLLFSTLTMNPLGVLLPFRAATGAHHRGITRM